MHPCLFLDQPCDQQALQSQPGVHGFVREILPDVQYDLETTVVMQPTKQSAFIQQSYQARKIDDNLNLSLTV